MNEADKYIPIHGIVPAAGLSRRMGRPKQTLPFGSSTITGTVVETMLASGVDTITVVTRSELIDGLKLPLHSRITVVANDDPLSEMIDSIRIALRNLKGNENDPDEGRCKGGILIVPGDMPNIPRAAYERTIATFRRDPTRIVIASHAGRRGHPMLFPWQMQDIVFDLRGGLNNLARRYPESIQLVDLNHSGVISDVNTPENYATQ